jgi:hypothetical protein
MSTATLTHPARVNTAPKLSHADRHVCCDECGKRLSVVLCAKCRSLDGVANNIGDQLWGCLECGMVRPWGCLTPPDPRLRPALGCKDCDSVTRHQFIGVA